MVAIAESVGQTVAGAGENCRTCFTGLVAIFQLEMSETSLFVYAFL